MQAGTITFITLRLGDSLPRDVIEAWDRQRIEYLRQEGIECIDWRVGRQQLSEQEQFEFNKCFRRLRETELDAAHGECALRDPQAANIVSDSLLYFDNERYLMGDFVVMPNHVHLLAVFPTPETMRTQCYSWMKFTATKINRLVGRAGQLWQSEPFDHLVRSEGQLAYLRRYIADNPTNAKLRPGEFLYRKSSRHF